MSNGNTPLEDEFRSSQIYKTLTEVGVPAANKLVQGLNMAVEGIGSALNGAAPAAGQTAKQRARYDRYVQKQANYVGQQQAQQAQYAGQAPQPTGTQQTNAPQNGEPQTNVGVGKKPAGVNPAPAPQMKLVHKGSPAKFYITAAAALIYALNFALYEPAHFIVFGVVLVAVFFLAGALFKGKKEWVPIEQPKPKEQPKKEEEKPQPSRTGNPEVDKLIDGGNEYLKKLRAANDAIPDETLSEDIDRMERASSDIFRYIADHPDKAPQIRKFMNYYLPTTLKLLTSYQRLSAQSVKGENITSAMFNIAGMMHTVADAFEKQLDSLFTDEAMDISADISVFETLLKQEGFVDEKTEKKQ